MMLKESSLDFIVITAIVVVLILFMSSFCNNDPSECKKHYCHRMRERDLITCIVILFFSTFFICTITMGESKQIAELLSFAGTLSSIILSVLAIIMTILAEKKTEIESIKMDNLVAKMENYTNSIENSSVKLDTFEKKIDKVIEREEKVIKLQTDIKYSIANYKKRTNNISSESDKFDDDIYESSDQDKISGKDVKDGENNGRKQ